jgi:acetoin utilization deacetylase AcuC-like enzyme
MIKGGKIGIISDLRMLDHRAKPRHPESPARVKAILKMLQTQKLLDHPRVDYISKYDRAATDDDIRLIYPQSYIDYLRTLWPEGETRVSIPLSDSYCSEQT